MLVAMTWMVLWAAWLGLAVDYFRSPAVLSRYRWFVFVVGNSLTLGLPMIAIAALFNRTKSGIIAFAILFSTLLCIAVALHLFTTIM